MSRRAHKQCVRRHAVRVEVDKMCASVGLDRKEAAVAASRGRPSGLMLMVFIAGGLLMVGAIQAGNGMLVIITLLLMAVSVDSLRRR